jgi:hypothetical protein
MNATPKRYTVIFPILATLSALAVMIGCQGMGATHASTTSSTTTSSTQATAGALSVTPGSVSFGIVQTGASQSEAETVTNTGKSSVTITQAPVTGTGFSISGLSLPLTLAAGQSANFNIIFSPTVAGSASGSLALTSNASNATLAIPLTASASPLQGQLEVTPTTLSLGSVTLGTTGTTTGSLTATDANVTVTAVSSSNSHFTLSGLSLPATIMAGQTATFTLKFTPQANGAANATLTFTSNGNPASAVADATGTGTTSVGTLAVTPGTLSLGSVTVGSSGTATGNFTATGANVIITAASSSNSRFTLSGLSLPATIEVGHSAPFTVNFSPQASGAASATLTFTSNADPNSTVVDASGTGTTSVGQLAVMPTSLSLGSVAVGAEGTATGSLMATGANVTITSASSNNSQFALTGVTLPFTIQAGQSAPFTVTFSPQTSGAESATLTFASNAIPSSTADMLSGTGTTAPKHTVNLAWEASTSSNIVGYNVYRSTFSSSCGMYARLNSSPEKSTYYGDSSVVDGDTYCYVTTAVNSSNEESPYSAVVEAKIPAP